MRSLTVLILGSVVLFGCQRFERFSPSQIVDGASLRAVLKKASDDAHVPMLEDGTGSGGLYSANVEFSLQLNGDDEARRRLMGAFREGLVRYLGENDATVVGWGNKGAKEDLRGFLWQYCWKDNAGFIDVRYTSSDGKGRVDLLCYEHLRGTTSPPPAKWY
jgi:hypothetical protein